MKKIGIIGGLGPESTVDYYKLIIGSFQEKQAHFNYPEIIIFSASLGDFMKQQEAGDWEGITEWLLEKVIALHRAGAEFAVIGSNTPHMVFDRVREKSPIPMLSIVEETHRIAQKRGFKKLGLLGTKITMESDFFLHPFQEKGVTVVVPEKEEQALIHHRLFSEIELGIFKESTRQELLAIVKKMVDIHAIEALILGCTELPLLLTRDEFGISFLNTTAIHAQSIVNFCLGKEL